MELLKLRRFFCGSVYVYQIMVHYFCKPKDTGHYKHCLKRKKILEVQGCIDHLQMP